MGRVMRVGDFVLVLMAATLVGCGSDSSGGGGAEGSGEPASGSGSFPAPGDPHTPAAGCQPGYTPCGDVCAHVEDDARHCGG